MLTETLVDERRRPGRRTRQGRDDRDRNYQCKGWQHRSVYTLEEFAKAAHEILARPHPGAEDLVIIRKTARAASVGRPGG